MTNTPATRAAASGALAALGGLKAGLSNVQASIPTAGGEPILRMGKDGIWVYGAENTEVEEGSHWAINPLSLKHGWVNWKKVPQGSKEKPEKFGDILVPMHEPKPAFASLPVYEGGEWSEQTSITLKCISGTDEGTQTDYKPSSVGGSNAMKDLIGAIMTQLDADPDHPVPVVELESDSYQHKTWGKTYVPDIRIVKWISMDGVADEGGEDQGEQPETQQPAEETTPAATGRRRAAPAAEENQAPTDEPPFEPDAPKAAAPGEVRRRRR